MDRTCKVFILLALLILFSCDNVSFFDTDSEEYINFRSVDDGTLLLHGDDLIFTIDQDEDVPVLTMMDMNLVDIDGAVLFEQPLDSPSLDEYRIKTENLRDGNYLLQLDFAFEDGSSLTKIVDFYYYQEKAEIDGIKSFPSHFQPYSQGLLQLQVSHLTEDMYIVWTIDEEVVAEGYGLRKLSWNTPAESGIYDILVDIYAHEDYVQKKPFEHYEGRILIDDSVLIPDWAGEYVFESFYPFQGNLLRDNETPDFFSQDMDAAIYQSGDITGMLLSEDLSLQLGGANIPVETIQYAWQMLIPDLNIEKDLIRFTDLSQSLALVYSEDAGLQIEIGGYFYPVEYELGNGPAQYTLRVDDYGEGGGFIFLYINSELVYSSSISIVPDFQLMDTVFLAKGLVVGGFGRLEHKSYEEKMQIEYGEDLVLAVSFNDNALEKENDKLEQMYRKLVILPGGIAELPDVQLFGNEFTIKILFDSYLPDGIEFESTITATDGEYILTIYSAAKDSRERFEYMIAQTDKGITISPVGLDSIDTSLNGELESLKNKLTNNSKLPVALKNLLIIKTHTNLINSLL